MSGTGHEMQHGGHGRHRRDRDAATWTPVTMPAKDRPGRHARPEPLPTAGRPAPAFAPPPTLPAWPPRTAAPPAFPPAGIPAPRDSAFPALTGRAHSPADDEPTAPQAPLPLPPDPFCPETAAGLGKFDLGTVPASVTPPTSWRRAALFTVFASAGVLVTLVFVSTSLMERPEDAGQINALPGIGTGLPYTASSPASAERHGSRSPNAASGETSGSRDTPSGPAGISDGGLPVVITGRSSAPRGSYRGTATNGSGTGDSTTPTTVTSYPPPTIVTETPPPHLAQTKQYTPPDAMVPDTRDYFELAAKHPRQAAAMTGGSLHDEGASGIESRYPNAQSIQVHRIKADPAGGTTTNSVTIHKADGSTATETRTLEFSGGDDPKIVADHA